MTFKEDFKDKWFHGGGLVSKAIAARLSGLSRARINELINENKLDEYEIEGQKASMVSLKDALEIERQRAVSKQEKQ